jgi:hypothetical protein
VKGNLEEPINGEENEEERKSEDGSISERK